MPESIETKEQICPKCGEGNPAEAVMCWACYTPLSGAQPGTLPAKRGGPISAHEPETTSRFPQIAWWRDKANDVAPFLLVGSLISSGWWRGKTRYGVLSAASAIVAFVMARQKLDEIKSRRRNPDLENSLSPIHRIVDTILLYAVKDNASQVRITRHERGVQVEYQIESEWREQMKIPLYVWYQLQNELQTRAESGAVNLLPAFTRLEWIDDLSPAQQNTGFTARILIEPSRAEILLTRLQPGSAPEVATGLPGADEQICPRCRMECSVRAVICWHCYGPLRGVKLEPLRVNETDAPLPFPQPSRWPRQANDVAENLLMGTLISSGWWRGKARFGFLGVGLGIVVLAMALEKRGAKERRRRQIDPRDARSPIIGFTEAILTYAVKNKASQVRISRHERGGRVQHQINGEWHEQTGFPTELWRAFQNEFEVRASGKTIEVSDLEPRENKSLISSPAARKNLGFTLRILIEPPHAEILLTRL